MMKTHPYIGYELVSRIDILAPAAEIVLTTSSAKMRQAIRKG